MSKITVEGRDQDRAKVAKFATFEEALVAAAREQFAGNELETEIRDIQERVIPAAANYKQSREAIGRILVEKHENYTKDRVWLKVLDAFAAEFGCCRRTVQNIHADAALALGAGEKRLTAIKRLGLNPFAARLSPVMMQLQNAPEEETQEQAADAVKKAVNEWDTEEEAPEENDVSQQIPGEALIEQVVELLAEVLSRTAPDKQEAMLKRLSKEALQKARETAKHAHQAQATSPASSKLDKSNPFGLTLVHSSTASAERQPDPIPEQPHHPEYLGCGSVIDIDSRTLAQGGLARMLRKTGATGIYIREGFELIAPPAFARFIANQVACFPRNIFLAATDDPDYFLEVETFLGGWPSHFWPGLLRESIDKMEGFTTFSMIDAKHKWLSLLLPQSDPVPALSRVWQNREFQIHGFDLVVAGGGVSAEDEIRIARTVHRSGCCFYSSSLAIRDAFFEGDSETFDRMSHQHVEVQDEKLKAIRTLHQLPPELGGPPEGAYCASDRKVWREICPPDFE